MIIKVCGITDRANAKAIDALAVDMLGFNFYKPSKRYIAPHELSQWIGDIRSTKVGVFVNEPIESMLSITQACRLDSVQLHGDEDEDYCRKAKESIQVIKVFRVDEHFDWSSVGNFSSVADMLLFDTRTTKEYGGSGRRFDWSQLGQYTGDIPYLVAGGIGPNDEGRIKALGTNQHFAGVDINSGFEIAPGMKNAARIESFIDKIKST